MLEPDTLKDYPLRRVKAMDGMAVTAQVWDESHEYHRQQQRYHALLGHGPGILAGLEVVASNPPDSIVYVLPGAAVDRAGDLIVVTAPTAYDIGATAEGPLRLILTYGESRPVAVNRSSEADQPLYVRSEFGLEASTLQGPAQGAGSAESGAAGIELARVRRTGRSAPITGTVDPAHPGPNALDLRFRPEIGVLRPSFVPIGVSYLGGHDCQHGAGLGHLAGQLARTNGLRACVDDEVPLDAGLAAYSLLCLVGLGPFDLKRDEMNALYGYLQAGGVIFAESCRRAAASGEPAADISFHNLFAVLGIQLREVRAPHPLLAEPNLFAAPPPGFATEAAPVVLLGAGASGAAAGGARGAVIFSSADYGCLWQGEHRGGPASREEIRSALEWGVNIIAYATKMRTS